jgi:hypothetical protein
MRVPTSDEACMQSLVARSHHNYFYIIIPQKMKETVDIFADAYTWGDEMRPQN